MHGMSMYRRIFVLLGAASILAACTNSPDGRKDAADSARASEPAVVTQSTQRLQVSGTATLAADGVTATVTVSDAKVIPAPKGWSKRPLVVTVAYEVTKGQIRYAETAFVLVAPDGTHTDANLIASSEGLPGEVLGWVSSRHRGKPRVWSRSTLLHQ